MKTLNREDLFSLEQYSDKRSEFRTQVMDHKKHRRVDIGPNLTLYFEDRTTVQYQIQEMLRIERIFEAAAIQEELDTYNPLIPDGSNWKATAMLEFEDVEIRRQRLAELVGIEHLVWVQVEGHDKVMTISNEDLERSTEDKTSAVHFMRFELTDSMIASLHSGAELIFGCDHNAYTYQTGINALTRESLMRDLANTD